MDENTCYIWTCERCEAESVSAEQTEGLCLNCVEAEELSALAVAGVALDAAEVAVREAVERVREAGGSWAAVGDALGVSRQAAWQRFGP